ncbi:PIG-L deacetylase family protein [Ammoniphilus sp. CFH 90114]|uniref:PIG-L deacetylase family protein n=1 Tax=Ammoniphilus sp. CFH 90114 TaxID=2493665 RepID=UPI00100FD423|nr:PIG-L family deacetylase [Ammoniphilus sp. CFH 90114]RXT13876.1 PIG-L family deacetylase [Ammoniphilus sp. CFH 90114]
MSKRILFIFAHPDAFATGATIAKYASAGVEIHLFCATRGEAGKTGNPAQCLPEELADVREQELHRAAKQLGIEHLYVLRYPDGRLDQIPPVELSEEILKYMDKIRPHVAITFPPHGISGHKDHKAIQQASWMATVSDQNKWLDKLYYITIPESIAAHHTRRIFYDADELITTMIDAPETREQIAEALLEHKTQNMSIESVYPGLYQGDYSRIRTKNYYILAWHRSGLTPHFPEQDLFEGI